MIRIQKILVPVDFSDASRMAVNYGLSFALESGSPLILAHIAPFDPAAYEKAKVDLMEWIPPESRERLNFEIIVKSGDVMSELAGIVEDKEVGLVVMGTHGRSYLGRMILGSVTERMLRKLHVPILTVSHLDPAKEIHVPGEVPLRRLMYATDLSDGSEEALRFSIRLARAFDASLTVAHVVRLAAGSFYGVETAALPAGYTDDVRARAEETLSRTVGLVSDGSVPISTLVAEGVPWQTINDLAAQNRADLLIISLQGKGRLERMVIGATAEHLIRAAVVPVLSLPLPAAYESRWLAA